MIQIFGPCNPRSQLVRIDGELISVTGAAFLSGATNLGEALNDYCQAFKVEIEPTEYYGKKFFSITVPGDRFGSAIYDPHVFRGGEEICPKQDLSFPLLANDILDLGGPLVC